MTRPAVPPAVPPPATYAAPGAPFVQPDVHPLVQPPVTLEGWYALHQVFAVDHHALRALPRDERLTRAAAAADALARIVLPDAHNGWSAVVRLVNSLGDLLLVHLRPTVDALGDVRDELAHLALHDCLRPVLAFVSVTELGLYHLPTDAAGATLEAHVRAERESPHARRRLYPEPPTGNPYVSFYPTSKRRDAGQNWYALSLEERSALMRQHGLVGRRHAGSVRQIITGALGLDSWEWGVTLLAADPLALKRVVTDMRYDPASARYADFGDFYFGRVVDPRAWALSLVD
jgi:hydrogen peroxide-dependent heme synthase